MNKARLKLFLGVVGIASVLLLFSLAQEVNRRLQYQKEVRRLEKEVQVLEKDTIAIGHLNQYFRTNEYQERLAREKLNYKAPGEKVVLIPHDQLVKNEELNATQRDAKQYSNAELWWRTFFVTEE